MVNSIDWSNSNNRYVRESFLRYAGREPTPQEVSRFRSLSQRLIDGMAQSIKINEESKSERGVIYNNALLVSKNNGVSLVSTYGSMCGIATYTENLSQHLKNIFKTNVIADTKKTRDDVDESISIRGYSTNSADFDIKILDSAAKLSNGIIHIQHEFGIFMPDDTFMNLVSMLKKCGFKVVVTLHTVRTEKAFDRYYQNADVIIVHSEMAAYRLYSNGINNLTVIKHGTEKRGNQTRQDGRKFLSQFIDISDNDIVITSPGFISKNKMQAEVMEAIRNVGDRVKNIKFILIGSATRRISDGDYPDMLKNLQTPFSRVVEKFTTKEEMGLVMAGSDICVLNYDQTHHSTSGMSHLVMSYNVPSVTSRSRILNDLGDSCSIKVDNPRDIKGFENAIVHLCENKYIRDEMSNQLKILSSRYSWENVAIDHVKIYNKIDEIKEMKICK